MGKFKVGQWVRALVGDGKIAAGEVGKVAEDSRVPFIDWLGGQRWAYIEEELEPWIPRVGERVRMIKTVDGHKAECGATVVHTDGSKHQPYVIDLDEPHGWAHSGRGRAKEDCGWWVAADDIEPLIATAEAPPAKFQIEAGKFYKTRDGRKAGPALPYVGNPTDYCWKVPADGLGHFVYTSDGRYSTDGYWPENDLISEWVEPASNDNAPVAEQPAAKPAKFKVGDVVTPSHGHSKATATVTRSNDDNDIHVKWNGGECGSITGWQAWELSLVTPNPTAIVALIENSKPKPADRPHVHASAELAQKEADRLANKFKGKQFGVYVLSSISEQAKPVYDHKWQRLAADGLKIDAIKELRGITGMGLKPAKDAVEYFLQAA